jgi:hypothetical protein
VFAAGLSAQESACTERTLPLSVETSLGVPLRGLAPSDFEAKLKGNPVEVLSIAPDTRPHRVVILLDSSGSMSHDYYNMRWNFALSLARQFAAACGTQTQLALLLFNQDVIEVDGFSKGNAAIAGRLKEIGAASAFLREKARGTTALYDAIAKALDLIDHPTSADAIYVITDGDENSSHLHSVAIEKLFGARPARLFASLLIEPESREQAPQSPPFELTDLSHNTGGDALVWRTGWPSLFAWSLYRADPHATVDEQLSRFYTGVLQNELITLRLSAEPTKAERLDLRLSAADRKKWKDAEVLYPSRIEPCAATAVARDAQP